MARERDDLPIQMRYQVGANIPLQEYLANVYGSTRTDVPGAHADWYTQTQGMTPQQFLQTPYSQWRMQPDGTVTYAGDQGWQNPTWIDQGGAGDQSLFDVVKKIAPYAGAMLGVGGALGGLAQFGIPGIPGLSSAVDAVTGGFGGAADAAVAGTGAMDMGVGLEGMMNYASPVGANFPTASGSLSGLTGAMDMGGGIMNYASPAAAAGGGAASGGAGALAQILGVDPNWVSLAGTLGSTLLGAYGADQRADAMENIANQARTDIQAANAQQRADRQPWLDAANQSLQQYQQGWQDPFMQNAINMMNAPRTNPYLDRAQQMLQNPDTYFQSPEAQGAMKGSLMALSAQHGNPAQSSAALAKQAAYNMGMYNQALNNYTGLGQRQLAMDDAAIAQRAGIGSGNLNRQFSNMATLAGFGLGQNYDPQAGLLANLNTNAALADSAVIGNLGSGLADITGAGGLGSMLSGYGRFDPWMRS